MSAADGERLTLYSSAAAFALLVLGVIAVCPPQAVAAEPGKKPLILAHYMPWFTADPPRKEWGWHWTMNVFDPQKQRDGKRSIAAHYYPLIGPYDSGDPAVLEYHLLLMKLAGIDGVVADWYGLSNHASYPTEHRNTAALFAAAAKLGLRVVVCYEDQTIAALVKVGKLPAVDRVRHARGEVDWLRKHWFPGPAYVKLDGKPVLLSFGNDGLTDDEWEQVFRGDADRYVYLSEHRRRGVAAGAFDWPIPTDHAAGLDRFYRQARGWPVSVPVAFPRFHDIYGEAKVHASWGRVADEDGRTFVRTLERALTSGAPLVQIATWNDFGEGTNIEPSAEFGYRDLEVVQRLRRRHIDAEFAVQPEGLRLAYRLYLLRRRQATQPRLRGDLDKIARLLAAGSLSEAESALEKVGADSQR